VDQAAWIDNRLDALARLRKHHPRGVGTPFCHVVDIPPRWSRAERLISQQACIGDHKWAAGSAPLGSAR
jgi:hypothetical protein